jgi:hypothetical protein
MVGDCAVVVGYDHTGSSSSSRFFLATRWLQNLAGPVARRYGLFAVKTCSAPDGMQAMYAIRC